MPTDLGLLRAYQLCGAAVKVSVTVTTVVRVWR